MATKLLPYGMTDFDRIIKDNYYYVDKTAFIPQIEVAASFFFFVRPRRFGKSLLINMLANYYDKHKADDFDTLFGDLAIGKNPTTDKNKYLILSFNFSGINGSTIEGIEKKFDTYCNVILNNFVKKYANIYTESDIDEVKNEPDVAAKLASLCKILELKEKQKIYLIIDEYDNFANNILTNFGSDNYKSITHGTGFFRAFLNVIKEFTSTVIERMFITGVSPVTMDDLTSGFNISANMSNDPQFNAMIGFAEDELKQMLEYYNREGKITKHTTAELIKIMKPWYNNYCFNELCLHQPPLYNSDMALYFTNFYLRNNEIPKEMLDRNVRTDYNKLRHLIAVDKNFANNASVIQEIITNGGIIGNINSGFSVHELVKPDNFISLLYYFGLLTVSGVYEGDTYLSVPNQVVKEQIFSYMAEVYKEVLEVGFDASTLNKLMKGMAYRGAWEPYFNYISEQLRAQSSVREFMDGEAHVKAFILAYMGMNNCYTVFPEYEMNKGYSDFFMQPDLYHQPDIKYSYVVEVKYAKRDADEAQLDTLQNEAAIQLAKYAECVKSPSNIGNTELRKIALIYRGWELVRYVLV